MKPLSKAHHFGTLLETNSSHLKKDGWNTMDYFWEGFQEGASC